MLAAAFALLLSPSAWASGAVSIRIAGEPRQVLALHRALSNQLQVEVRSKRISGSELTARASTGGGDELTVWVELGNAELTRVIFTRGGEVVGEREISRNGANDDVHFEELALAIRSAVEALSKQSDTASVPQVDSPKKAVASELHLAPSKRSPSEPGMTNRSSAPPVRDLTPSPEQPSRTPFRLDFEPSYAATTYAEDQNLLFGIGVGLEAVAQQWAGNPGLRLSTDTTTAFEFTESRPRVAHGRALLTLGIEHWLPARWGIGLTAERVIIDTGNARTESQSLVATLMGELRLVLGDRVDGVFGTLFDIQMGEPRVVREDGGALERHRLRLSAYLGVAITAAGER